MDIEFDANDIYDEHFKNKGVSVELLGDAVVVTAQNSTDTTPGIYLKNISILPNITYQNFSDWMAGNR